MEFLSQLLFLILLISCNGETLKQIDDLKDVKNFCPFNRLENGSCPNKSLGWSFVNSSDYTFDSNFVEISSGRAVLKEIDTEFSGSDFSSGTHSGTHFDNNKIEMIDKNHSSLDMRVIIPNKLNNLVGYWRFDSNADDESLNSNSLNVTGDAIITTDSFVGSGSARFDGNGDSYFLSNSSALNQQDIKTVSLWVKKSGDNLEGTGYSIPFRIGQTWYDDTIQLRIDDGTPARASFQISNPTGSNNTSASYDNSILNGVWYHVVLLLTNTELKLFLNGELVSSNSIISLPNNSNAALFIGKGSPTNSAFNGDVDEVSLWNTELTESEIREIYRIQSKSYNSLHSSWTPYWSDIVGYWKMDGNWQDSSGKGNHGVAGNNNGTNDALPSFTESSKVGFLAGLFDQDSALQYVRITNSATLENVQDQNYSMQAWYRPSALPNNTVQRDRRHSIFVKQGCHMGFTFGNDGKFRFDWWNSSCSSLHTTSSQEVSLDEYYHLFATVDYDNSEIKFYINGVLQNTTDITGEAIRDYGSATFFIGSGSLSTSDSSAGFYADGAIDDVAVWSTNLSESDVKLIYNRQKQKYAASYKSPVIDLASVQNINQLSKTTDFPFMKELTTTSESSSDYTSLSGDLSIGLVAYYPFLKDIYTGASNEVLDLGSNIHHGQTTNSEESSKGVLGYGKPSKTGILIPSAQAPTISDNFTIAFWMRGPNKIPTNYHPILVKGTSIDNLSYVKVQGRDFDRRVGIRLDTNGIGSIQPRTETQVLDGSWHHVTFVSDGSKVSVYVDGRFEDSEAFSIASGSQINDPTSNLSMEGTSFEFFEMDEVAIWSRDLSSLEIRQLYRRGTNRIKYQVRACSDSTCSSDPEWKGPGGDGTTYFSELYNRSSADISSMFSSCDSSGDNLCSADEFSFAGATQAIPYRFDFVDSLINSYSALNARYFQYRVLMEAEENTACDGEPCLPSLTEINFKTEHNYYTNAPSITSTNPVTISGEISKVEESVTGGCSVKYQFSKDGTNFSYYSSGSWTSAANSEAQANTASQISSNLKDFIGSGSLYVRAYLLSNGTQSCELESLNIK